MAAPGYVALGGASIALSANATKTVLTVTAGSGGHVLVTEFGITFDGTTASAVPILVELCRITMAGAGTGTSVTPVNDHGYVEAVAATAKRDYSVEPTVVTAVREWFIPPTSGLTIQFPLGRELDSVTSQAVGLRCTTAAGVTANCRAFIGFEE